MFSVKSRSLKGSLSRQSSVDEGDPDTKKGAHKCGICGHRFAAIETLKVSQMCFIFTVL